ncbi:MAG: nucleotide sugar dehydrogenase [Candidatus Omnitrophota bacterium]
MNINVFGLGYVGNVVALKLVEAGHDVIGIELIARKVKDLQRGRLSIFEPGLEELLSLALKKKTKGRLSAVTKLDLEEFRKSDGSIVCVGTPSLSSGEVDLHQLVTTLKTIGQALKKTSRWHDVIIRSTVSPGTTQEILVPILEAESGKKAGRDFGVGFYPEFLREGIALKDFSSPSLNVLGCYSPRTAKFVQKAFLVKKKLRQVAIRTAEMIKYANNSFHALKVSFANEIGTLCKAYGVDSEELADVFLSDTTLNVSSYYLRPGFAFGGSCFPKEIRAISSLFLQKGIKAPLVSGIAPSNDEHISRLISLIQSQAFSKIGFLGITFKPDTDDIRESPLLKVLASLLKISSYQKVKALMVCDSAFVLEKLKKNTTLQLLKVYKDPAALIKGSQLLILGPYRLNPKALQGLAAFKGCIIDLKYFPLPQKIKNKPNYHAFC